MFQQAHRKTFCYNYVHFVGMEIEVTIFLAYIMAQIAVLSPHRTMALLLTPTLCHLSGQFCLQMLMTKQMKG